MAYILIDLEGRYIVALEKTTVAYIIGVHRHTISNRINKLTESENTFAINDYKVIIADEFYNVTKSRGNRTSLADRKKG